MQQAIFWESELHRLRAATVCNEVVEKNAVAVLHSLAEGETISTTQLVDKLYPPDQVRGDAPARQRLFDILTHRNKRTSLPVILRNYRSIGPEKKIAGKVRRGWLWHCYKEMPPLPTEKRMVCCPNCQTEWEIDP